MKKSFLLHVDALSVLNELSDQQAGQLFKAILNYQNGTDLNPFSDPENFGLRLAFLPFKNQFLRDGEKYAGIVERNQQNGKKGGRPKKENETEKTQPVILKPKKADNDNVSENDKENEKEILENSFFEFWENFNKRVDRAKCLKTYSKIKRDLWPLINQRAKQYQQTTPDPKYRKNPLTWLNGCCWEDQLETTQQENKPFKYIPTL